MSTVRLPGPERREQLLRVARAEMAKRGFHETSMNDIAEAAGVTKPVVYQHFASKTELYDAVLEDIAVRLQAAVFDSTTRATSGREMVELGFRAYLAFVRDDYEGFSLLFSRSGSEPGRASEIARAMERSVAQQIAALITVDGIDDTHRLNLAHGVVGMAEGMVRYWRSHRDEVDPDELADDIATLAWVGLRGLQA